MMDIVRTLDDKVRVEESVRWEERGLPVTVFGFLSQRKDETPSRPAVTFQIMSDPRSKAETLTWAELHHKVTQAANVFHALGIEEGDVVALLLPNSTETVMALLGGAIAGVVSPINPLLDADQIAGILNASKARILVTLKSFPKTNIAQLAAQAVSMAPTVQHILEVDLCRYLSPPKSWLAPLLRPKTTTSHSAHVSDFNALCAAQSGARLNFDDSPGDRVAALFHTGGTTGIPKLARHTCSGIIYNGWASTTVGLESDEVVLCPLPLFHVFAAYPALFSAISKGCHLIFPTPAGYRGEGVLDNFWKLVERWKVSYILMVPTAAAALMQRTVNADVSSLKTAICGSAPMPLELCRRFEETLGIRIIEGYGLTEATCLVSVNPLHGVRKVGSVGLPIPYTHVRIVEFSTSGDVIGTCKTDQIGEICIASPGVLAGKTYMEDQRNVGLFMDDIWLRTGDLGKIDTDGYVWITGRTKDLIIRGGQNVDPAWIEDALLGHESVAFAGAVGQPDADLGELPCAYVELVADRSCTISELQSFAAENIGNRLAQPAHIEILDELPKTAVGKIFKPDLRKLAIARVLNARFETEGLSVRIQEVVENPTIGLEAIIPYNHHKDDRKLSAILGAFNVNWRWSDETRAEPR